MAKRTSPSDAQRITISDDLEDLVQDKREGWRASNAKSRRRQRRYKNLLTSHLTRMLPGDPDAQLSEDDEQYPARI